MRKWNGILTAVILVLFVIHGILGGFQLLGAGNAPMKVVSWTAAVLVGIHTLIGLWLTARSFRVLKSTGQGYFRQNALFWARRISGLAVMLFLIFHMTAFSDYGGDVYRLKWFTTARLTLQLLLVLSLAVHIISNVKPLLITFGIRSLKEYAADILIVLSAVLFFAAAAFIVYYLRWNAF